MHDKHESGITDADYQAAVEAEEEEADETQERIDAMTREERIALLGHDDGVICPDSSPYCNHGFAVNCDNPLARGLQFSYVESLGRYGHLRDN